MSLTDAIYMLILSQ